MAINKSLILLAVLAGFCLSSNGFQVKGVIVNPLVARTTHMIDSNGWYHVFGEVLNPAADNVSRVVSVNAAFTSGYSAIASATTFTILDTIRPGENASFNIVLADSAKSPLVDGYSLSLITDDRAGNLPYRLSVVATSNSTDGSGNFHVSGTVTNNIGTKANFVQVIATFKGGTGNNTVIYTDWVYSNPINLTAGQSTTFEIVALNSTSGSKITRTVLQAQCTEDQGAGISDFSLRISPPLTQSVSQGGSVTYKIFTVPNSLMSYSATSLTFSARGLPSGSTTAFSPSNVTVAGTQVNLTITTSSTFGVGVGSFLVFVSAAPASGRAREFPVFLTVNAGTDFALSISPPSQTVSQDAGPATFTVTATSSGGFSSTVTLNYSNVPSGSTANFSSSTIVPTPSGATRTFRVYVNSSTALGTKLFTICGQGGSPQTSHCIQASVTVTLSTTPSFTVSISPSTRTVSQNSSTSYDVTVGSTNGFNSQVSLTLSGNPTGTTGAFSPATVTPPPNGNGQSTLTITTSSSPLYGTYNLTVTGTRSGYPTKTAHATLIVRLFTEPDFALYALPKTVTVAKNGSGSATIQVVSINSFTGSVALSLQNLPSGVTYSIVNPTVTPLEGGYVYTKLTLQTSSSTPLGDYDLTIGGTSGSKTHTVALGLQVINKSSPLPFKCIIATATYGSEIAPEVQYLRVFRDSRILTTVAGTEFMKVFNAWYYSFSPYVASWITDNPESQGPARVIIMPLLGILHLSETAYTVLGFAPETAATLAGIVASFLIGMLYFGPILTFAYRLLDQDRFRKVLACGALTLAGSLTLLTIGLSALLPSLVMIASSILVLSTVSLGSCSTHILTQGILSKIRQVG